MEGTYPLPEAQLDRFLLKLHVPFPTTEDLRTILERTTGHESVDLTAVLGRARILEMRRVVRDVAISPHVQDYAIRLLQATHPDRSDAPLSVRRFVRFGSSPRGAQACIIGAKVSALFDGRFAAGIDDVRHVLKPALRHRIIRNFEGEAEGVEPDRILDDILSAVPESQA
jgi:MoxR-like ATPase